MGRRVGIPENFECAESEMTYTFLAISAVLIAISIDRFITKSKVFTTGAFWFTWLILLSFQLITNGWLTGRKIVTYDELAITGWRLAYAPIEDLMFGFSLILLTISVWIRLGRGSISKNLDEKLN